MDEFTSDELERLIEACERDLGPSDRWFVPDGYPSSLALCVIDTIFSIGVRFQGVINVLNRYRTLRAQQDGNADEDSITDLLRTFDGVDPGGWADLMENRQRTSTRSGILKAEAVQREAHVLSTHRIFTTSDLQNAVFGDKLAELETDWKAVPGQNVSWGYLFILARPQLGDGITSGASGPIPTPELVARYAELVVGVKPDRMIIGYVERAIGIAVKAEKAAALVRAVARAKEWDVFALDHTIWRYQSKRPHLRP